MVDGVDRMPELLDRFGPELELESGVPAGLLRLLGALPSYYLHYYYCLDQNLAEQAAPGWRSRAEVVAELEAELLAEYRDPALVTKPDKLSYRGGAFYSEAAVRLIASLHAGTGDVQVVDVRNDGGLPGLPDDAVVEIPCTVDRDGAHPAPPAGPAARHGRPGGPLQGLRAAGRRGRAVGEPETMIRALVANPLVGQYPLAERLADALLAANRQFLPRFFPDARGAPVASGPPIRGPSSGFALRATEETPVVTSLAGAAVRVTIGGVRWFPSCGSAPPVVGPVSGRRAEHRHGRAAIVHSSR